LQRYSNFEYVINLELFEFLEILNVAIMKNFEDKLYQQWLVDYGVRMDKDHFTSFNDYKEKRLKPKVKKIDTKKIDIKKIIEDAEKIKNADLERRN
jgi:hypothetical protein